MKFLVLQDDLVIGDVGTYEEAVSCRDNAKDMQRFSLVLKRGLLKKILKNKISYNFSDFRIISYEEGSS